MEDKDLIIAKYKKRYRIMAIISGLMTLLAFTFFLYAIVQKGIADENQMIAVQEAEKAQNCSREAMEQKHMAEQAMEQATLAQQKAEAALQKALKK